MGTRDDVEFLQLKVNYRNFCLDFEKIMNQIKAEKDLKRKSILLKQAHAVFRKSDKALKLMLKYLS